MKVPTGGNKNLVVKLEGRMCRPVEFVTRMLACKRQKHTCKDINDQIQKCFIFLMFGHKLREVYLTN